MPNQPAPSRGGTIRRSVDRPFLIAAAFLLAPLLPATALGQAAPDTVDVLFIGNSYVYYNNLADQLEQLSLSLADGPLLRTAHHLHGGFSLRRHLEDGHLPDVLGEPAPDGAAFEVVILQEQSTLGVEYRDDDGTLGSPSSFLSAATEMHGLVEEIDADVLLYMTWAKKAFPDQTDALSAAYGSAGSELDAAVAPVGLAWARVRAERDDIELFHSDGSHPSPAGTYLTACVFYATLTGLAPNGAASVLRGQPMSTPGVSDGDSAVLVDLPPETARYLQSVAWAATRAYGDR